jgi:hypothetical protein
MKLDGVSDFIIDETDIGFDGSPLSNDNGSEILGCVRTGVVVGGECEGGTAAGADSDSVFLSLEFLDAFVLIVGERLFSLSSSCISFFNKN